MPAKNEKRCKGCLHVLPIDQFTKKAASADGYEYSCKACKAGYMRAWRTLNPKRDKASKNRWLAVPENRAKSSFANRASRYGMSSGELASFLTDNPNCAICGLPGEHLDHDHGTGRLRGHLCNNCNKGLGHFKDSPARLANAITYLQKAK